MKKKKEKLGIIKIGDKCDCGFKFAGPGEFRNCDAFITKNGEGGVICPKCNKKYL